MGKKVRSGESKHVLKALLKRELTPSVSWMGMRGIPTTVLECLDTGADLVREKGSLRLRVQEEWYVESKRQNNPFLRGQYS